MRDQMLDYLKQGIINWIETDHAPHALQEKINDPYMSGLPGLPFYPRFARWLQSQIDPVLFRKVTFDNICKTFELDISPRPCTPHLDMQKEYPYNPYAHLVNI
jgi:dihydroorotase-like cyclic amidohydrolase